MLGRVIFKKRGYFQLTLSTLGAALGFFVLLAGLEFYLDLKSILLDKEQMATTDFLVLHKKVGSTDMMGLTDNGFSSGEVEEIRQQPYVNAIGEIVPGLFKVDASLTGVGKGLEMNTAMFFEAVDEKFIDLKKDQWKWHEGEQEIPIILPSILLESYNFGMAPSQNLPPITEKTLMQFGYDIEIRGNHRTGLFKGRIIGFSDRINTILVPMDFVKWANKIYPDRAAGDPTQLVIEVEDVTNPELARFLKEKGYETNQDKLQSSRIKSILNICLAVFLLLGVIIILMSALTFIQYARISVYRVSYELKTLMAIGYHYTQPAMVFIRLYTILNLVAFALAFSGLWYFKQLLSGYFEEYYFSAPRQLSTTTLLTAGLTVILFFSANVLSVYRLLKNLAKTLQ